MPPKAKIAAPIDRPLSRAYLREFSGWSTAYPPGLSEPTSLRVMENMAVNRDGSLRIRPGLRYLSYATAPGEADGGEVVVPYSSSGWSYLRVPLEDTVDHSSDDFTSWATCTLPAGNSHAGGAASVTTWLPQESIWLLRDLGPASALTFTIKVEDHALVYVNGVAVLTQADVGLGPSHIDPPITVSVRTEVLNPAGPNILAVRANDELARSGSDNTWVDIEVSTAFGSSEGVAFGRPFVGTHEPFYLNDGTKAYLLAVREEDQTVGFRVLVTGVNASTMYALTHPLIDFDLLQPTSVLNFSAGTTYVKYLQIDNKIFALSDNGEPMRVFTVGEHKTAKALQSITQPDWQDVDKLRVVEPDAAWINGRVPDSERRNRIHNPSFETNLIGWTKGDTTDLSRPQAPTYTPISGTRLMRLASKPARTNLATSPLHDVATTGVYGWGEGAGDPLVVADGDYLKVQMPSKKGVYFAHSRLLPGVDDGRNYQVAFGLDSGAHVDVKAKLKFFGVNGAQVGETEAFSLPSSSGRWVSPSVAAPKSAVSVKVAIGGENLQDDTTNVRIRNVVVCRANEDTALFTGNSGTNYFWTGAVNRSASVYHPPAQVEVVCDKEVAKAGLALAGSLYIRAGSTTRNATLTMRTYNKDGTLLDSSTSGAVAVTSGAWVRLAAGDTAIPAKATHADLRLTIPAVARGEYYSVDAAMIETDVSVPGDYFDGSTPDTPLQINSWAKEPHASGSIQQVFAAAGGIPDPEDRTADTLRATGGSAANPYSFAFFYTFNNEVGESAASKITVKRAQRAWSEWAWETPNALGEPSGTETDIPEKCADQLVAIMPEDVFNTAMDQGATSWSLYMFTWSNQDPAPVVALKVGERELPPDALYVERGWLSVTPSQADITDDAPIPTERNRHNYSDPSHAGQGLVAADRMILVNDPAAAAVIRWSSNRMGEYTNFTSRVGGGYKTLTSGNLYVPACVKLWQNPQSADTLTILCLGTDGQSAAYYMAPAQVTSQSDATSIMGFEETTATAGTTSPYGVEVLNNALYHPIETELTKSTASNYNISHKPMTDQIANVWKELGTKYWIISSQLDNRLYYLVNNLAGEELAPGCKGNELWVFDAAGTVGTWSRFLIQAHALRKIEFGGRIYMSVIRPDGVYYLDPDVAVDAYVDVDLKVPTRPIDWKFETNTQGANRAHDAWAHLQQVSAVFGNFTGALRYGIRGWDVHGRPVDRSKVVQDSNPPSEDGLPWDIEDFLMVQRDMKEWQLYGESLPGVASSGQVSLVQYRYAPISVNVGYEYGSVETFEYTRNVALGNDAIATNGIPVPAIDTRRP